MDTSDYTATYSPEDDKIRLYCAFRLDSELYARVKSAGFRWAPKQDLFYAYWSPKAEDMAMELADEIGDEDTSLVNRAEIRADRFEGYSEKRAAESEQQLKAVDDITQHIPLGQPILIGHHSERKARKDAEKIERGMERAVKLWETSEYWQYRAKGALRAAKYKERPDVRARRIKKLEAENRKYTGYFTPCPKTKPIEYNGDVQVWCGKGRGGHWVKQDSLPGLKKWYSRIIAHNDNRLIYEKAMLDDQGGSDLLKPNPRPKQPPLLNYRCPEGLDIENKYHRGEYIHYPQAEMTKAEYAKVPKDYKGGEHYNGHRVRVAMRAYTSDTGGNDFNERHQYCVIFLTDSKEHANPNAVPLEMEA